MDNKRLRQLIDHIDVLVWVLSYPNFEIKYVNKKLEETFGQSHKELVSGEVCWKDYIHEQDKGKYESAIEKLLLKGKNEFEYRIVMPSGGIRLLEQKAWVNYDDKGNPVEIEGISKDITERRKVEDQFFKGKALYYTILKSLPGFATIVFSPFLKVIHAEGELLIQNKVKPEKLLNKSVRNVINKFSTESIPGLRKIFKGESFSLETMHKSNFYELSFSPLRDINGRIESGILLIQDVTKSKQYSNSVVRSILVNQETINNQLAFNIHEDIGQMIYGIKLQMDRMEKNELYDNRYRKELKLLKDQICNTINQIKSISKEISPSHVEDFGLELTLPNLLDEIRQNYDVQISLHQEFNTERFSKDFELSIYKFFKEMFSILIEKQKTTNINIYIKEKNGYFYLKILNNGIGFDDNDFEDNLKLEARINAFNGNFKIVAGDEQNENKIVILIPVEQLYTF